MDIGCFAVTRLICVSFHYCRAVVPGEQCGRGHLLGAGVVLDVGDRAHVQRECAGRRPGHQGFPAAAAFRQGTGGHSRQRGR